MTPRTRDPATVPTMAGALAVLLSSFAFVGVLSDARWMMSAVLVLAVVAAAGMTGRRLGWWPPLTVLAQLFAVVGLLVAQFSGQGFLLVVPTPGAIGDLSALFNSAIEVVRTGVPPVEADQAIQCLVSLGLGLVAVIVDAVAVAAGAPAVSGLVLLCVFAIPASLAESMLPWGSFVAGALGFTLLLAYGRPVARARAPSPNARRHAAIVISSSTVLALLFGSAFTGVGTEGRLPGDASGGSEAGAMGLRPFTSLRGQLDRDNVVELFRVRGLPEETYLRAMTLRKFDPNKGWRLDGLTQGVSASGELPSPTATDRVQGEQARVEIDPVGYRDPWLPVFGIPQQVNGMGPNWRYDPSAGIVFTQTRQDSQPYVEHMTLPRPSADALREASGRPSRVDPAYLDVSGVPQEIAALGKRLTADEPTDYDKAVALNRFFTDPENGFTYDLSTAPPQGNDALVDFLFHGKRGFCEQYASSMAALLRTAGIPSRVAVGFTAGTREGDERVITTNDAHAWVEAYFPEWGWVTFDPTPLDDGRAAVPQHMEQEPLPGREPAPSEEAPPPTESRSTDVPVPSDDADTSSVPGQTSSGWPWRPVGGVVVLLGLIGAVPFLIRQFRRQYRLRLVASGAPGAAEAAWNELLDEFRDRGKTPGTNQTLRGATATLVQENNLEGETNRALDDLVGSLEREWYAPSGSARSEKSLANILRVAVRSVAHDCPLSWRDRLFPRSVLRLFRRS